MTFGERSSDRPETALACSSDPPDSIGTTSPRIRPIPDFGEIQGRSFVVAIFCALSGWSSSSVPSSHLEIAGVIVLRSSLFKLAAVAVLTARCDVTANQRRELRMFLAPGFQLPQNVTSGESCQIVLVLVARTLWALLSLSRGSSLEFGHRHILVLSGGDVTSKFSSPDFRLSQNATSQERSLDHCHTFFASSSGYTGLLERVSTRILEMSVFNTFRGRLAMRHHKALDANSPTCCHAVSSSPDSFRKIVAS